MFETTILTAKTLMLSMMVGNAPMDVKNVEETYCMSLNIYYEARGEGWKGKTAVAHVVQNRVAHEKYPDTICDVVKSGVKHPNGMMKKHKCQFSWYCDGKADDIQIVYKNGKVIKLLNLICVTGDVQ